MTSFTSFAIIVDDNAVMVDGIYHTADCSSLAGIHAVLWDGQTGSIEHSLVKGLKKPPLAFTDPSPFEAIITAATG